MANDPKIRVATANGGDPPASATATAASAAELDQLRQQVQLQSQLNATLSEQLAQLKALVEQSLSKASVATPTLAAAAAGGTSGALVEKMLMEDLLKQRKQREQTEEDQNFHILPGDLRTQIVANQRFPDGKKLWAVQVGWCPRVVVKADDKLMAKARYDVICGIQYVREDNTSEKTLARTTYVYADVTDDRIAQQLVQLDKPTVLYTQDEKLREVIQLYNPRVQKVA